MDIENIIANLHINQLDDIDSKYKLSYKDILRLASHMDGDPFSISECCKWKGAISISANNSKYINFWFKRKKYSLHRILYINYKNNLPANKYLRFSCQDYSMRGMCCNINHIDIINNNISYNNNNNNISYHIDTVNNNNDHDIFVIIFND